MKTIIIETRNVYGNWLIYPVCEDAKAITRLTGKLTLSLNNLKDIKSLGYTIQNIDGSLFNFSI
jgi:hypothetical protein